MLQLIRCAKIIVTSAERPPLYSLKCVSWLDQQLSDTKKALINKGL